MNRTHADKEFVYIDVGVDSRCVEPKAFSLCLVSKFIMGVMYKAKQFSSQRDTRAKCFVLNDLDPATELPLRLWNTAATPARSSASSG